MGSLKQKISEKWSQLHKLDTLRLEVTEKCNLKCVHCYLGHRNQENTYDHIQLEFDKLIKVVKEAKELGAYKVVITGGEPFLYPDFIKLCRKIKELNFMLVIYTNGTLIDDQNAKALSEIGVNMVLVSNYGTETTYFENTTKVSGSHQSFKNGIKYLKKWDVNYKLQTVLLSTNEENRDKLWEVCKPRVDFRIFVGKNGSFHPKKYRASDEAIKDVMKYNYQYSLDQKEDKNNFIKDHDLSQPVCNMGRAKLIVETNGEVKACTNSKAVGNIKHESLTDIWNGDKLEQVQQKIAWENYNSCQSCSLKKYRYNICPVMNYLETGDMTVPPEEQCRLCRLRKEVITEIRGEKVGI